MTIAFRKTRETFGWLSNMSPHPIEFEGILWPTAEHLFQALRINNYVVRCGIRIHKSPMAAKMFAKSMSSFFVVRPQSEQDVANMLKVLRLKVEQHENLREALLLTGTEHIIEDVTKRPHGSGMFWGAALIGGEWKGENTLGKLWEQVRSELS